MEQSLYVLLIKSAVVSAVRFEFAVKRDVTNHHSSVATVH